MNFLNLGQVNDIYADGQHDDTKAIQKYLDKMKNGGTIYFPDGTYIISAALIFYSNQTLKFSDNAVLLRSDKSEIITKYMLASYSDPDVKAYEGTHDVIISGGIFDGNKNLSEKLTVVNTVHCRNITIENVRFVNGAMWHYIELNSTENAEVVNCVFDGNSYTVFRDNLTSELIQIDAPFIGTYGPVYDCDGNVIDFNPDGTPCRQIIISGCIFKCNGFPAIGHHGNDAHGNIKIHDNVFEGLSGSAETTRGFISFIEKTFDVYIFKNAFISKSDGNTKSCAVMTKNINLSSVIASDNTFTGRFDNYFIGGISPSDNYFNG